MNQQKTSGFTIIEIIITITIMAILASIVVVGLRTSRNAAEHRERVDDVEAIARHFESYHSNQDVPSYPATGDLEAAVSGIEAAALKAPNSTTGSSPLFSLQAAPDANAPSSIPVDSYIYQPFNSSGALCTTQPCERFKIWFAADDNNTPDLRESVNR